EVKPNSADGTAFLWESRSPPFLLIKPQFIRIEVFLCHIIKGNSNNIAYFRYVFEV
ncbi:MAG: hypothetical protein ACJA1B_001282, partial [Polaribacter sp.]